MSIAEWVREFQELHERMKQAPLGEAEEARWRELKALLARQPEEVARKPVVERETPR